MTIRQRIRRWWIGSQQDNTKTYALDEALHFDSPEFAAQENLSPESPPSSLVAGLPHPQQPDILYEYWMSLSAREQDVAALTCLRCTNRQIAFKLGISVETVRSYLQNAFYKLSIRSKTDLRVAFAAWDFREWGDPCT